MPSDREKLILVKGCVDIMREFSGVAFPRERFGASASNILLCMAIFIGQAEGRPMGAAKLASYVGIPRSTVIRRLSEFMEMGIVERIGSAYFLKVDFILHPGRDSQVARSRRHVLTAAQKLSKLDT